MSEAAPAIEPEDDLEADEPDEGRPEPCGEGADWNTVERAFLTRRSIRKFKKKQVPAHLVRRILEVGRYAPSQGNCQPYRFAVIREPSLIDEMEAHCVEQCKKLWSLAGYTEHPKGSLRRLVGRTLSTFVAATQPNSAHPVPMQVLRLIAEGKFTVFHHAPTLIGILMDRRGIGVPEIDIGIVGTNIVMAAESQGLGTCWVGFSKLLNQSPVWRERLGIDGRFELSETICVGFPVGKPWQRVVPRATHEIAWFEGGEKRIVY
ncbi:NADH dehydrogenase [Burkholderiales bacterium]|nr:NADH dehydrogenase [Burkholderiales bacterium]